MSPRVKTLSASDKALMLKHGGGEIDKQSVVIAYLLGASPENNAAAHNCTPQRVSQIMTEYHQRFRTMPVAKPLKPRVDRVKAETLFESELKLIAGLMEIRPQKYTLKKCEDIFSLQNNTLRKALVEVFDKE